MWCDGSDGVLFQVERHSLSNLVLSKLLTKSLVTRNASDGEIGDRNCCSCGASAASAVLDTVASFSACIW